MRANQALFSIFHETLIQVRVPVPLSLKTVNSYLLKDKTGYVWIDPGLNTKHIQDVWKDVFEQLNIKPNAIHKIICTHQHPDHFGLAGLAQGWTGAPVYISRKSMDYARLLWEDSRPYHESLSLLFIQHGVPITLVEQIEDNLEWFKSLVYPFPEVHYIDDQQQIEINYETWRFVETSGHAKGQMMLYHEQEHRLLCGDQVLPHITPHVGVVPTEEDEYPLVDFIESLNKIRTLDVSQCYAGHGENFTNWTERIDKILSHHERRLQKIVELCEVEKEINAFQMSNHIFGTHLHQQPQNLRFAITEIIAHLDYLARENKIKKQINHPIIKPFGAVSDVLQIVYRALE